MASDELKFTICEEAQLSSRDLTAYLARIEHTGTTRPDLHVLMALQQEHLAAIPFEAIDALLGKAIHIDAASVQQKLVERRRGGYCYEQNGLFARALRRLGYAVEARIARVLWGGREPASTHLRTHMALLVHVAGTQWFVDVGFGAATPTQPLRWDTDAHQETPFARYRLSPTAHGRLLEVEAGDTWRAIYEIYLEPPAQIDFEVSNWFTSTHPASPFRRDLMLARATAEGRFTLFNAELTHRPCNGAPQRETLAPDRLETVLRDTFRLSIEPDCLSVLKLFLNA